MDAGVPITDPVAGISIGLVKEPDRFSLLTDIMGDEDHFGDMDFKVAGTQHGICGIQLDLKIDGIGAEIIQGTLEQAREGRIDILKTMLKTISRPRDEISQHAPRLLTVKINPEKIGLLIGPGGKTIKGIQEATGAKIDIEDDGTVFIAHSDAAGAEAAKMRVEALTRGGQGRQGLRGPRDVDQGVRRVHRDPAGPRRTVPHLASCPTATSAGSTTWCQVGDMLRVKVISIDDQDRVKLSRKVLLREENPDGGGGEMPPPLPRPPRPEGEARDGGERRGGGGRGGRGPSRRGGGERRD